MQRNLFLFAALVVAGMAPSALAQRVNVVSADNGGACAAALEKGLAGAAKVFVGGNGMKNAQGAVDGWDKWFAKKGKSEAVVYVAGTAEAAAGAEEAFGEGVTALAGKVKESGAKLVLVLPEGASKPFSTMAMRLMDVQGMKAVASCEEAVAATKQAIGK